MAAGREGKEARWRGKMSGCGGEMTGLPFAPPRAEFGDFFFFHVGSSGVHAARAAKWTRGRNREAERTSEEKKEYK